MGRRYAYELLGSEYLVNIAGILYARLVAVTSQATIRLVDSTDGNWLEAWRLFLNTNLKRLIITNN